MGFEKLFKSCINKKKRVSPGGCGGALYFLGFIGALIYFWSTSTTFLEGVIGFFKALVWPAFLVYELMMFLGV